MCFKISHGFISGDAMRQRACAVMTCRESINQPGRYEKLSGGSGSEESLSLLLLFTIQYLRDGLIAPFLRAGQLVGVIYSQSEVIWTR